MLLPVLVFRAQEIFNEDSPDDLVRIAVSHQYELIEDAVLSEAGSSQWRQTMNRLADRFAEAYGAAEKQLAARESLSRSQRDENGIGCDTSQSHAETESTAEGTQDRSASHRTDEEDEPGVMELLVSFQEYLGELTEAVNDLPPAIESLTSATSRVGQFPNNATPREAQNWSFRAAQAFTEPSLNVKAGGARLLSHAKSLDGIVVRLRAIAREVPDLQAPLTEALGQQSDLKTVREDMARIVDVLRPAEFLSAALRRALRPLRSGLTDINDAIAIIEGWSHGTGY